MALLSILLSLLALSSRDASASIAVRQQYVGGQLQTNALAGDGQTPTEWVAPEKQKEALELLLLALAPANLDVPDRVVASLLAPPSGRTPSRKRFASDAGASFDGLLSRLLAASWGAAPEAAPRLRALQRIAQRAVLESMLGLGANTAAAPEVRGTVITRLVRLRAELRLRRALDPESEAHLRLAERDLNEFLDHPEARKAPPRPAVPPGRPIGF